MLIDSNIPIIKNSLGVYHYSIVNSSQNFHYFPDNVVQTVKFPSAFPSDCNDFLHLDNMSNNVILNQSEIHWIFLADFNGLWMTSNNWPRGHTRVLETRRFVRPLSTFFSESHTSSPNVWKLVLLWSKLNLVLH